MSRWERWAPVPGDRRQIDGVFTYGIRLHAASGNVIFRQLGVPGLLWRRYCWLQTGLAMPPVRRTGTRSHATGPSSPPTKGCSWRTTPSDNTISANEVYYSSRHGIELFGDSERFGNLGRVANRNVVVDNVFFGTGFNDLDTSAGRHCCRQHTRQRRG